MKYEINCEIIRDLLPPYADGLASVSTRGLVDEHLKQCEPCGRALDQLCDEEDTPPLSPERALGRVKKQISKKRRRTGIFATLGTLTVLIVLYLCLFNTLIPLEAPPSDLQCSAEGGVVTITSSWDSQQGYTSNSEVILEDGSKVYVIMFSLADPPVRKIFPKWYATPDPVSVGDLGHGMKMEFSVNEWDGGVYRVYFIQERELKKGRIMIDDTTGKLTEDSMQYATLVWEEAMQ